MKKNLFTILFLLIQCAAFSQNSILWEISGNGLPSSSYLMGTLKFISGNEFFLPKEAIDKMNTCKIFAIEDEIDHKAQLELNKAVYFPKGKTLDKELTAGEYRRLREFFNSEFKITNEKFDQEYNRMTPLALSINMTRMSLGGNVKYYDIELLMLAKKNKIATYSLESVKREAEALRAFPMKDQVIALMHSVDNFEKQKSEYHQLEAAYLLGDLDKVFDFSLHPAEDNADFIGEFYTKRNFEWLPKIVKMINDKPSFIAIGVSHLEGENGLLKLLRDKGFTLTPIPVTH
jgi:uncharacterized protein YbaP (TraB family)